MDNIEEATQKVPHHVEERLEDFVPDLHEPRAVEAVSRDHHDQEVEGGEEGAEDDKDGKDGREADIEKAMEDGAEKDLEHKKRQKGGDNWAEMHRNRHRPIQFLQLLPQTEKAQSVNPQTTKYRYRRGTKVMLLGPIFFWTFNGSVA